MTQYIVIYRDERDDLVAWAQSPNEEQADARALEELNAYR